MSSVLIAERYRLVRPIGTGGMGRVWLARDEVLHRDVAIKEVIPPAGLSDAERVELRERTLREARAAARLSHPNVVQIYDVVHTEQRPWIVMEYVQARSLHQLVRTGGPLSPQRTAEIGLAVLAALTAAHAAGVLHRDVKPSNVLIADDGRVVLSDFGLATIEGGESAVTRPGLVLGSPQYIAPERARDGISSPAADLWSLGATLYAAVEGRSPYARTNAMATLTALATANPDPTDRAGAMRPVLNGLLRRNPRARLAPEEVQRLLRKVAAGDAKGRLRRLPRPRPSRESRESRPSRETRPSSPSRETRPSGEMVEAHSGSGTASTHPASGPPAAGGSAPPGVPGAAVLDAGDPEPSTVRLGGIAAAGVDPDPEPARRIGRRYRRHAIVLVLVLAVVGSAVFYTASRSGGATRGQPHQPAASASASSGPSPVVAATGDGTEPYVLPADWGWYTDPAGFRDAVPRDWAYAREGPVAYFRGPGGRELGLEELAPLIDPVVATQSERGRRVASGELAGYTEVKLDPIPYFAACAEWEYTYDRGDGKRMHAIERRFITPAGRSYRIVWAAPDFDFTSYNTNWYLITASFHPSP